MESKFVTSLKEKKKKKLCVIADQKWWHRPEWRRMEFALSPQVALPIRLHLPLPLSLKVSNIFLLS